MAWIVAFMAAAGAAEPARCIATWEAPVPGCPLRGTVSAVGGGRTEAAARRATLQQMAENLSAAAEAMAAKFPGMPTVDPAGCEASAVEADIACYGDRELAEERICIVGLDDRTCWSGDYLKVRARGWEAIEQGRTLMCSAVAERVAALGYEHAEQRQAACRASCQVGTTVVCPGGGGASGN